MHDSTVQASVIADSMTIIATSTGSRTVLELAIALRAITTGKLGVPPRQENDEMVGRIARNLLDPQWNARTQAALGDSRVEQLARHFYNACVNCVSTNAPDPLSDETWLMGVRSLYSSEQSMQFIAEALINQFAPLSHNEPTAQAPAPPPAPVVAAIPVPAPISTPPAPSPAEIQAKLIARLRLIARAWRFVHQFAQHWKAQQARKAAALSSEPISAPVTSCVAEKNSPSAPAIAPIRTPAPAEQLPIHSPWFTGMTERASAPINAMVLPPDRYVDRRFVGPVVAQGRFVNTQRGACGLSPP